MCTRVCGCGDCTSSRITRYDPASYGYDRAESNLLSPIQSPASPTAVGISSERGTPPVAAVPEDFLLFNTAITSQTQPETSLFPRVHASSPDVGLVASRVTPDITDRPREGPFDAHHDRQGSPTSPQLLQRFRVAYFA